ncbi:hypothetical protein MUO98_00755 [Candidatus Bathyarchaeota archaeon]|nr:hypothetical protein [Candidatus Bathyarchaeota archaeon]
MKLKLALISVFLVGLFLGAVVMGAAVSLVQIQNIGTIRSIGVEVYGELYENTPRETICEIALNIQEAKKLIEQGFKYETGEYHDGGKLFSKYK